MEAIPVAAGLGEELMKILRDNNEGRFNGRWTGERPPIRVSQNTRTGTGNIKLEVFSYPKALHADKQETEQLDPTQEVKQMLQVRNRRILHRTVPTPKARQL